jgi:transcriptional regulator with XRE-family HTH domain
MDEAGIDDRLREAIRNSGQSARQIAKGAGVSQGSLSRFLLGADMRISSAARVARWLGLELRKKTADA